MPRTKVRPMTEDEWRELPVTLDRFTVARLMDCTPRYVCDHAEEFGGRKIAGRWLFSKARIAKMLGM